MLAELGQGKVLDAQSSLLAFIPHLSTIVFLVKGVTLGKMNPLLQNLVSISSLLNPYLPELLFLATSPSLRTRVSALPPGGNCLELQPQALLQDFPHP